MTGLLGEQKTRLTNYTKAKSAAEKEQKDLRTYW